MLKLRKNKKGFTLVELIVVIAIMAVLAGVVAGVTVSQLYKQTDKTGQYQANTVAQFLSQCALTGEGNEAITTDFKGEDGAITTSFVSDKLTALLTKQYQSASITVDGTGGRGMVKVSIVDSGDNAGKIEVYYQGKQSGTTGDVTYYVAVDGTITKVTPTTDD